MEKIGLVEREERAPFLKPLLSTTALLITFKGEKEAFTLMINERGEMEKSTPVEKAHLTFLESKAKLLTFFMETSHCRILFSGKIKVKGSFRALLKLEAILWLTDGFFKNSDLYP